jgi:hypothetical protein
MHTDDLLSNLVNPQHGCDVLMSLVMSRMEVVLSPGCVSRML